MSIKAYPMYDRVEIYVVEGKVVFSIEVDATTAEDALFSLQQALKVIRERKLDV